MKVLDGALLRPSPRKERPLKNYDLVIRDTEEGAPFRKADLVGCLDSHTVIAFEKSIDSLLEDGTSNVLLNLENLSYISSAGISALMSLTYRLRQRNGELVLLKPTEKVYRVFKTLGFTSIFKIITSDEEVDACFTH